MKTKILSFDGIDNIGLYVFVTDSFALVGMEVYEKYSEELKELFKVPVIKMTIAGTSLIGVFVAGTKDKILVPSIAFESELETLKENKIDFSVLDTKLTCLGNNMFCTEKLTFLNPDFSDKTQKKIQELLNTETLKTKLAEIKAIGSLVAINKNKLLTTYNLSDKELKLLEDQGFEVTTGSISMGSQYIKSGVLVNSNGLAVSKNSGGPELVNAEEALKD